MDIITDKIFDVNHMIGVIISGVLMSGIVYLILYKFAKAINDDEQIRRLKQPKKIMGIFSM